MDFGCEILRIHFVRNFTQWRSGEAEEIVQRAGREGLQVMIFRPSVIVGPDDGFFNRFAQLLRIAPYVFPLACPKAHFAPVFVGNVVAAFERALTDPDRAGQRYELCGPRAYSLEKRDRYTSQCLGNRRRIIPLNEKYSQLQARILERVPGKPMSLDIGRFRARAFVGVKAVSPASGSNPSQSKRWSRGTWMDKSARAVSTVSYWRAADKARR